MPKPSSKSPGMEQALIDIFGIDRVAHIEADTCTMCENPATHFDDDLSRKEYTISGLCQQCQDSIFN